MATGSSQTAPVVCGLRHPLPRVSLCAHVIKGSLELRQFFGQSYPVP
jgi:hypothetical protein